jgi:hypothetical protein
MEQNKYARGKIYKLVCSHCNGIYVGSTTEPKLARRFGGHKNMVKQGSSGKLYNHMRNHIDDFKIVLLELYPCTSKDELRAKEDEWINELEPSFNSYNAVLNEEKRRQNKAEYRQTERFKELNRLSNHLLIQKYIQEKKYHCETCDISFPTPSHLNKHLATRKHNANVHFYDMSGYLPVVQPSIDLPYFPWD